MKDHVLRLFKQSSGDRVMKARKLKKCRDWNNEHFKWLLILWQIHVILETTVI